MRSFAIILLSCLTATAFGDIVYLKNGGSLEGDVVQAEDGVIVKLPAGEVRISKEAIVRIELKKSPFAEYNERAAALKDDDADGHSRLGLWAQGIGLKAQAKEQFLKAIAANPNQAQARQALGYILVNGKWVTEEEEMLARGMVKYDGHWMSPEAAARLQTLKAELEVAREKRLAAEAELKKTQEEIKASQQAAQAEAPAYAPNPYDYYYMMRGYRDSRYYGGYNYGYPAYPLPFYYGPYGGYHMYPGGHRFIPRR